MCVLLVPCVCAFLAGGAALLFHIAPRACTIACLVGRFKLVGGGGGSFACSQRQFTARIFAVFKCYIIIQSVRGGPRHPPIYSLECGLCMAAKMSTYMYTYDLQFGSLKYSYPRFTGIVRVSTSFALVLACQYIQITYYKLRTRNGGSLV